MFYYRDKMGESKRRSLIYWGVYLSLSADLLLAMVVSAMREPLIDSICAGTIVGQCGVCCAAFLRNENMRGESFFLFIGLLVGWIVIASVRTGDDSGYIVLGVGIAAVIGVATHILPVIIFKQFFQKGLPRFSILKIMLATAAIGAIAGLLRWGGETSAIVVLIAALALALILPSSLACWLMNFTHRTIVFLPVMLLVAVVVIILACIDIVDLDLMAGLLLSQTFVATVGGVILLQVKPTATALLPLEEPYETK